MFCRNYMLKMYDSQNEIMAFPSNGYEAMIEHTHDFIELVYIVSGTPTHCIKGKHIPLKKGDMFVIATNDSHSMTPSDPPEQCQWINCIASHALFPPELLALNPTQHINFTLQPDIIFLVNQLVEEYHIQNPYFQEIMRGHFSTLLYKYHRASQIQEYANRVNGKTQKDLYIHQVTEYIRQNYQKKIYLKDISQAVGISIGYMNKIFREERATTPIEYLNICRISIACHLLVNSDASISEICEQVGFHDMKFFYTMFKRQNGISPGVYRKMNRVKSPL